MVVIVVIIVVCRISVYIPSSNSLKNKRSVIKRVIHMLRNKFNVSVCELEQQDALRNSTLGIVYVSNDRAVIDRTLSHIEELLESYGDIHITDFNVEII